MDHLSKKRRSWNMARIGSCDTIPEKTVRAYLFKKGFGFRTHDRRLHGTPDIVLRKYGTVVFIHGCFWHQCPKCSHVPKTNTDFWEKKFKANIIRDKRNESELKKDGWHVVVVWECEIPKPGMLDEKFKTLEERRLLCLTKKKLPSWRITASSICRGNSTKKS